MKFLPNAARTIVALIILVLAGTSLQAVTPTKFPKNIIVFIADGAAYNTVLATNYYRSGQSSTAVYESFPVKYSMSTYFQKKSTVNGTTVNYTHGYSPKLAWSDFNYVMSDYTDSAPAATSMSTGTKTYDGAIGVDKDYNPLENMTQRAKALGKSAGVVSSVQFSHATPAGYVAHNQSRNNYSAIANEMLNSDIDVIMGAGHPDYDDSNAPRTNKNFNYVGGETTWNNLKNGLTSWTLIDDKAQFEALMTGTTPTRVVGVPRVATTLQQGRSGATKVAPFKVPQNAGVPTLEMMTKGALNVLDNNPRGFFVMIEGGAIDWANHANDGGRMIEEHLDFDNSVQAAINWVNANSNWDETLIIVTSDHECGYITGPNANDNKYTTNPIINNGAGVMPTLKYNSGSHTNTLVPFYAKGAGSELFHKYADEKDSLYGYYLDNTELGIANKILLPTPANTYKKPKNVIYMISDGWGLNNIVATNYYKSGTNPAASYQNFPIQYYMSTFAGKNVADKTFSNTYESNKAWTDFNYVMSDYTDSAPAATSMSSGKKSYDGAIGVNLEKEPIVHFADIMKEMNKSIGVVSSVQFSHATPAGFLAHNVSRNNYQAIAWEMLHSHADVIMGAGHPDFDDNNQLRTSKNYTYVGGQPLWDSLKAGQTQWALVDTKTGFQALTTGNTPSKVVGVAQVATTLQQSRSGATKVAPYTVASNPNVPTLETMTKGALNVLDNNQNGFFVMIEGGAVDWANHANDGGRMIEEQIDFNDAVDAVINWIETNSNWDETLLLVTGDHECGYFLGPNVHTPRIADDANPTINPITNNGQGNLPGFNYNSGSHTNMLIPFYAKGAGSEIFHIFADQYDRVFGKYINNTETAEGLFKLYDTRSPLKVNLKNVVTGCKETNIAIGNVTNVNGTSIDAAITGGSKYYTYTWTPTASLSNANTTNPTYNNAYFSRNYYLMVTDQKTGEYATSYVTVNVAEPPAIVMPMITRIGQTQKNTYNLNNAIISPLLSTPNHTFEWRREGSQTLVNPASPSLTTGINTFRLTVVNGMGCKSIPTKNIVVVSSRKDGEDDDFAVAANGTGLVYAYPTPVVNSLNVEAEFDSAVDARIKIVDMSGRELFSAYRSGAESLTDAIDMSRFEAGVYMLIIETENDNIVKKIVKQ